MNREIWPFLFFLGLALFNWPFLHIFGGELPAYLFGIWALFILAVVVIFKLTGEEDGG
ncbi:MAG: hypothetical protein PVJ36_07120 [Nitrospirota bacterium]|jgi:hypothetical protein